MIMIKKIMIILIIITTTFIGFSFAEEKIRIGIDYNKNIDNITLSSDQPLRVEYNMYLLSELEVNEVRVMKSNDYYLKYNQQFDSLDAVKILLDEFQAMGLNPYIHYNNHYEVRFGPFNKDHINTKKDEIDNVSVVYPNNEEVVIKSTDGRIKFSYHTKYPIDIIGEAPIHYNGRLYRGGFQVRRFSNSDLTVINHLGLDEYLYGVVPKEMPADWEIEALKAQAIAARNFAIMHLNDYSHIGFDLTDDINSQVYGGLNFEKSSTNKAVDETSNIILKSGENIVSAFYHSNSGGQTESVENVWSAEISYLKGVKDEFSEDVKNATWQKSYTLSQISLILNNAGYDVGHVKDVVPLIVSENNRVLELMFKGANKNVVLEKGETRRVFGYFDIKSMWFEIDNGSQMLAVNNEKYYHVSLRDAHVITSSGQKQISGYSNYPVYNGIEKTYLSLVSDKITFRGKGFGHGVGMSQWGAKVMAERGYNYEQILKHYYQGTYLDRRN